MKYVAHFVRKYIIDAISTNVTYNSAVVPIYGDVPSTASTPYITVYSVSQNGRDRNSDDFSYDVTQRIEVVTEYGRGRQNSSISEQIMTQALDLIVPNPNSVLDMSADSLRNYGIEIIGTNLIKEEYPDNIYVRCIADLAFYVEEV